MKYLILGDVHLGKSTGIGKPATGKGLNSRNQDKMDLLRDVQRMAATNAAHIIITGDIYDEPRPHPELINEFMGWMVECETFGIQVHIIAGNHDIIRSGSHVTSAVELVNICNMKGVFFTDVTVLWDYRFTRLVLAPYRDKRMYEVDTNEEALECLVKEIREAIAEDSAGDRDIKHTALVGHFSLKGALNITDEITDSLNEIFVPPEALSAFADTIIMGHIHHPQEVKGAYHVGSMDRTDFSVAETDIEKRVLFLEDGKVTSVPLSTRNLRQIDVDIPPGKDSTDFAINTICLYDKALPVKDAIVRLNITLAGEQVPNVDRPKVEDYIYTNLGAHHICQFSESRNICSIEIDQDKLLDNSMDVMETVEQFAETQDFEDDDHKARFMNAARECHDEYQEKQARKTT
jgi:DNA repair exonuclease SbcCD nuclease subunit